MADKNFPEGLIVKAPRDKAPDFVKASISIKREELIAWLAAQSGDWINLDVKESKQGKWYAAVNDYQPKGRSAPKASGKPAPRNEEPDDSDFPF